MSQVDFSDTEIAFERKTNRQLKETLGLFKLMNSSFLVSIGSNMTLLALKIKLPIEGLIKKTIFKQFCGGATFDECRITVDELAAYKVETILDYGAEGKESASAFDITVEESLKSIGFAAKNDTVNVVSCKVTGLVSNAILEKRTAGAVLSGQEQKAYDAMLNRMHTICKKARELNVALFIDAEESWYQGGIDEVTNIMMETYNKSSVIVYNTYQMYRHDRLAYLKASAEHAKAKGYVLGAKIVRGAYMEKERERAKEMGYPSPIQSNKKACDEDYNAAIKYCSQHHEYISSCVASHNEYSTQYQITLMNEMNIESRHKHFNFCQLYGMSDNLTFNLAKAGFNVAKYVPYGPVKDVVPYLIRRAKENSAVDTEVSRELQLIKSELKRRKK